MTEQRKRLEKALRSCAEAGVPDTVDLWSSVKERTTGERTSAESVSEDRPVVDRRRRFRAPQLVPDAPLGWVLAAVSVLMIGAGVYAAAGPVRDLYRQGLPGTVEPGSEKSDPNERPVDGRDGVRTEIGQTQTADGARVTLDWAYADERFVMVGLRMQGIDGARKSGGVDRGSRSVALEPLIIDDTVGNEDEFPPYVQITDRSGQDFDTVGGGTGGQSAEAVFDVPEGLEPDREHRFRLRVPLQAGSVAPLKPEAGPFVFDFEVPVRPAPAIEIDQEVEVQGITVNLKQVIDSPANPQAVVCFRPPDSDHDWRPLLRYDPAYETTPGSSPQQLGNNCWMLGMAETVEGRSSVVVASLEGMPRDVAPTPSGSIDTRTIRGPWTFEFEAPER